MTKWMQKTVAILLTVLLLVAALPVTAVMETADGAEAFAQEELESALRAKAKKVKVSGNKTMTVGEKQTLKAVITPSKASQKVKWTSSNKKVATVSSTGVVTAKKAGKVTITATAKDGSKKKGTIKITVKKSSGKKYYALIVGNYDYVGTQNDLIGPRWDAAAFAGMLKGLSGNWKVTTKSNLTAEGMKSAIKSAFSGAKSSDVCLFYYSGHGVVASSSPADDDYQGALVGYDESLLLGSQLAYALSNATPGHVIVLLDSCGSGGMLAYRKGADGKMEATDQPATAKQFVNGINNAFKYFDMQAKNKAAQNKISELRNGKFHVFTACAYRQVSTELFNSSTGYGFGIFTMCFLEGVGYDHEGQSWYYSYSPADTSYGNSDGKVSYTEIGDWTYDYVNYIKSAYPQFGIEQDLCGYSEDKSFVFFIR